MDGALADAKFDRPNGVAVDSSGNVYVADTLQSSYSQDLSLGLSITRGQQKGCQNRLFY